MKPPRRRGSQSVQQLRMEVATLCALIVCLRLVPNRSQFFQYESVALSCEGQSSSDWTVKRNTSKQTNQDCPSHSNRTQDSTCPLETLYPSDSGAYWCESAGGERSSAVHMTVTDDPLILESPGHPVAEGEALRLHCRSRTTSFNLTDFYRNDVLIGTSSAGNLTLQRVSKSDEGTYKCNVSGVGQSQSRTLTVREASGGEEPPCSLTHILLPVLGVCLPLIVLMLFCLWRNHKGKVARSVSYTDVTITQEVKPQRLSDVGSIQTFYSGVNPDTN